MAVLARLTAIGILIGSFLLAFVFYFIISSDERKIKMKNLEQISGIIINFIIYVWVAKVVLNIAIFIRDPIAVLAYPSDSRAFYFAFVFLIVHIIYQGRKDDWKISEIKTALVPIFLSSSFVYEFIQLVSGGVGFAAFYLGLLFVLLLLLVIGYDRWPKDILNVGLMIGWAVGALILSIRLPYLTVFNYMMSPLFLAIILVVLIGLLIFNRRNVVG